MTRARRALVLTAHRWGSTQVARAPSQFLMAAVTALDLPTQGAHWAPEPADGTTNPLREVEHGYVWPVPIDPAAWRARREAAEAVDAARRRLLVDHGVGQFEAAEIAGVAISRLLAEDRADPAWVMSVDDAATVADWDEEIGLLLREAATSFTPDHSVVLPASLSASQVVRLAADPAGFARDLARPMPRPPAPAARRGTRFHAWVESLFGQAALIDLDDLAAADASSSDDDLLVLQQAFLAGPYAERAPLQVEAPFVVSIGRHIVRGRIDAVYEIALDDGSTGYEVVDWKTGAGDADPLQLAIYRLAWAELARVPAESVRSTFYYVARGEVSSAEDLPDAAALGALLEQQGSDHDS